jgi:hypothetical protein
MPQETIVKGNAAQPEARRLEQTREWFRQRQVVTDAPSIASEQPYIYENGTAYEPRISEEQAFIPDRGFDGPA